MSTGLAIRAALNEEKPDTAGGHRRCVAHGADSGVQRLVEREVLRILRRTEGWELSPETIELGTDTRVSVDGVDRQRRILVEVIARIGRRSASRDHKLISDATKLFLVRKKLGPRWRTYVCGCDESFVDFYRAGRSRKWQALALEKLGVEVRHVALSRTMRFEVEAAQAKQALSNRKGR